MAMFGVAGGGRRSSRLGRRPLRRFREAEKTHWTRPVVRPIRKAMRVRSNVRPFFSGTTKAKRKKGLAPDDKRKKKRKIKGWIKKALFRSW